MARGGYIRVVAALAALALMWTGAWAEEGPADAVEAVDEGAVSEEMPAEAGEIDLAGPEETEGAAAETATPKPTKAPKKEKEWHSSINYPDGKISFEGEIWAILTGKWGLSDYQAAGLMSSIQAESSFCPYNAEGMGGADDRGNYVYRTGDSVGFGLCQWTSAGRKAALRSHAVAHGSEDLVWDFDIQMGFMGSEIDFRALKSARTLYEATEWAAMVYERPSQSYANGWPGTRYERARKLYASHTGQDYAEPALRFEIARDGAALQSGDTVALKGVGDAISVRSNYYWRLTTQKEGAEGWLEVRCAQFYHPEQMERCACGYVLDGEKALTLAVAQYPPPGQTWRATLMFDIYRGEHEARELTVSLEGPPFDLASLLREGIEMASRVKCLPFLAALAAQWLVPDGATDTGADR